MRRLQNDVVDAYCERVGFDGSVVTDEAVLSSLVRAQSASVPFENFDIHLGRAIALDDDAIFDKLVRRRRGGYCYELNLLLRRVLECLGFSVQMLAARTRLNALQTIPKTHMALLVRCDAQDWIVDAGFGAYGLSGAVPFAARTAYDTGFDRYRILRRSEWHYVLQVECGDDWSELYEFTTEPLPLADFEMMNYYNSTAPGSRFRRSIVAACVEGDCRTLLNGRSLRKSSKRAIQERVLETQSAYQAALRSEFGLELEDADVAAVFALTPVKAAV
ncbi:MAG TPA: arylamine N-acetyltransferase [Candidatus Baltobacteraceae bacterium]|jgi:N-hydroxyarylamine O-acetyltransferase|nr:arylamine N-acetyltransferase [Candidatus Baltobacteraceae bacterium]